jgi:hypothetical protein
MSTQSGLSVVLRAPLAKYTLSQTAKFKDVSSGASLERQEQILVLFEHSTSRCRRHCDARYDPNFTPPLPYGITRSW